MKKYFVLASMLLGIALSLLYLLCSYVFVDTPLMTMIGQTKPGLLSMIDSLQKSVSIANANRIGLWLLVFFCVTSLILVFSKKTIRKTNFLIALAIPSLLVFAYPIVSRDIFSYLYYAKMVLVHHQNPYLITPLANSGTDLWLGFVHNVERVYVYGPIALLINVLPMALAGGEKLIVNIYLYKIICLVFFLFGTWLLLKLTKSRNLVLILWVLNPFIINELLINGHNDLMMIVFFWWAIYLKKESKTLLSLLAYALSVGTKFVTAPLLPLLFLPDKLQSLLSKFALVILPLFLIYHGYLTWYLSWIYFCLPWVKLNIFQIIALLLMQLSLTLGYAGFLETGMWGPAASNQIVALIANSSKPFIYFFVFSMVLPFLQKKKV